MGRERYGAVPKLTSALYAHLTRQGEWANQNVCLILSGQRGSGKTSTALCAFENKKCFYFSFRGLCSESARKVLCAALSAQGIPSGADCWNDLFAGLDLLAKTRRIFIFDDLDEMMLEKDFAGAFQAYVNDTRRRRVFIVCVHTTGKDLSALNLTCREVKTTFLSIATMKKAHPNRTGTELVELFTLSGGIPHIASEFQDELSIDDNLKRLLTEQSAFVRFAWEVLVFHYRRPETYAFILYALALGNGRISEVGKFTGYPYNKCDKYIKSLIEIGLVKSEQRDGKSVYTIVNSYFEIWFRYLFPNRWQLGSNLFIATRLEGMLNEIRENLVPTTFTAACFAALRKKMSLDLPVQLQRVMCHDPFAVQIPGGEYVFDCAKKHKGKAVFVKIFHEEALTVGKEEFETLEAAVIRCHPYPDSCIYLFAKHRFSDWLVHEASFGTVKLFNLDRLRFRE